MSLSQEPALSILKNELVCGYRDISKESYAGFSGKHDVDGNAIKTSNGAGPHNLQTFLMTSDGTVLHCLPGYWNPSDLAKEVEFAGRLHDVWTNPAMSLQTKRELFQRMQIAHIDEHPHSMVRRSNMQGFDKKYEIKHRLHTSDTINNVQLASYGLNRGQKIPRGAFKTTDVIMHERMAARPFVPFSQFDVAQYVDYGRPKYDKNEDFRDSSGKLVDRQGARSQEMLGQVPAKKQRKQKRNKNMKRLMRAGGRGVVNYGLRAAFR